MINSIPLDVQESLKENRGGIDIRGFKAASGGCINNGGRLSTTKEEYFLKWNSSSRFPGMFEAEAKGLMLLSEAAAVRIPEVILHGEGKQHSYLLMEYIDEGSRKKGFFERLGYQLAQLHRNSQKNFGLDHSNYIGSLPQNNDSLALWSEFFITQRLEPQIRRAIDDGVLDKDSVRIFEKLFPKLENYFPLEKPALLHGDLWSGNFMTDEHGDPCLFDPAVYYGHREMDISMTRLFGGFDKEFYTSYQEEFPHEKGLEERIDLYNLYPLLVHVNLFGMSYWMQVSSILRRFT